MKTVTAVGLVTLALACAPLVHADSADQASAEQAVTAIYNRVQRNCTPSTPPHIRSITWTQFQTGRGGLGTIHDANPSLGGDFEAKYAGTGAAVDSAPYRPYGLWGVNLEFC